ncbi:MAG: antibiotic biosynthesis monooxygenase [Bacteroidota bacterium]
MRFILISLTILTFSLLMTSCVSAQSDTQPTPPMATATVTTYVTHPVADYDAWKKVFDSIYDLRRSHGELSYEVGTLTDQPGTVYVINTWASIEDAKGWLENPEIAENMAKAGVTARPMIQYLQLDSRSATDGK